jgi:hypothetical protein
MARVVAVVFLLLACAAISSQGQSTLAGDEPGAPPASTNGGGFTDAPPPSASGEVIDPPTGMADGSTPIPGTVGVNGTIPPELREDNRTESTVPPTCASDCVATTCDASAACVHGECVRTFKTAGSGCSDIEGFTGYCSVAVSAERKWGRERERKGRRMREALPRRLLKLLIQYLTWPRTRFLSLSLSPCL